MNIFILDNNPRLAAMQHCDKHVVKMILETAQMLSTVRSTMGLDHPYKPTHKNHPCTVWASQTQENYVWLWHLGYWLSQEYTHRYGKIHKSSQLLYDGKLDPPDADLFGHQGLTPFAQAMPDCYKSDNPVDAYRSYYLGEKRHILSYTRREQPTWVEHNGVAA